MPVTKMNVIQVLDHGVFTAPLMAGVAVEAEPKLLPGESAAHVMEVAKTIRISDKSHPALAKIIVGVRTPAEFAAAMIKARYDALGGAKGFLGIATGAVTLCPDGIGYFQHFKGGSIYWSPGTGAHEVHGAIRAKWSSMGWERSFLGYPRTDETVGRDPKREGRYNHFQGGSIYWHPQTGAREVHGAIRIKYLQLGAEGSFLGYPATDETVTPDKVGRFNHFQKGSIYWTPSTWAHEVHGLIRNFWAQNGWERNPQLGYPITDERVPNSGIGHTSAPTVQKPLVNLPADVLRVPDEQVAPNLKVVSAVPVRTAAARISTPTVTTTAAGRTVAAATASPPVVTLQPQIKLASSAVLTSRPIIAVNPSVLIGAAGGRSQNRFGDFENGVVFWRRGSAAAELLQPRAKAPDGSKLAWSAAEVASLANTQLGKTLGTFPGAALKSVTFIGTTGYSYDGSGLRNRAHRLRALLQGRRRVGATLVAAVAMVEVKLEISFDPVDREIVGYFSDWSLVASQGDFHGGGSLDRALHARLDPALAKQFLVARIPATKTHRVTVLSVKTHSDGRVAVYVEP